MTTTTDPNDPRLGRGQDTVPVEQNKAYLVLSPDEIAKGFQRPVRFTYVHVGNTQQRGCQTFTTIHSQAIAETYARDPNFYGSTYCCNCCKHLPVGEFVWKDGSRVGS